MLRVCLGPAKHTHTHTRPLTHSLFANCPFLHFCSHSYLNVVRKLDRSDADTPHCPRTCDLTGHYHGDLHGVLRFSVTPSPPSSPAAPSHLNMVTVSSRPTDGNGQNAIRGFQTTHNKGWRHVLHLYRLRFKDTLPCAANPKFNSDYL